MGGDGRMRGGGGADRRRDDANMEIAYCEGRVEEHARMWWVGGGGDAVRRAGSRRRSRWKDGMRMMAGRRVCSSE